MTFALGLNTNLTLAQNGWVNELSVLLGNAFRDKSYGEDLKELYVGLIIVKPEFEVFFKPRRLKYKKGKHSHTKKGQVFSTEDCCEYELKFNYSELIKMNKNSLVDKISDEIIASIDILKAVKKLKDFDFEGFKHDLMINLNKER